MTVSYSYPPNCDGTTLERGASDQSNTLGPTGAISTLGQNKAASIVEVRKYSTPLEKLKKLYIALEIKQKPYR